MPPSTTSVQCFHSPAGQFLGIALVQVGLEVDAEKIRRAYSGEKIDGGTVPSSESRPQNAKPPPLLVHLSD